MSALVYVSQHPLVRHKLTLLRSELTEPKKFRELVREIAQLLFYEASRDLALAPLTVQTPLAAADGSEVAERIATSGVIKVLLAMQFHFCKALQYKIWVSVWKI
jgi:uracil phosphoribosyltransferase